MLINKQLSIMLLCVSGQATIAQTTVFKVSGRVQDAQGKGIAGVVVNDGVHFMKTDSRGNWHFTTDTCTSKFVSISTPADYELQHERGLARFYKPIREVVRGDNNVFTLVKRVSRRDDFTFIAISDPQVQNERQVRRWETETVPDLKNTVDSISRLREVVGMTLGDLVWDRMNLFTPLANSLQNMPMTVFQTIGNHDFAQAYQDLHNMKVGAAHFGEEYFFRHFGPTDYSFNIGKVHVVSMKNINYVGRRRYMEALTDAQLDWLAKDLSYVPKGSLVFLNMHAAGWNTVLGEGNMRQAEELEQVLRGYRVHFFCGHTHYFQNIEVNDSLYQHNIGAACGAWWAGGVNRDGSPNGYMVVDVKGDDVKWRFKPTAAGMDMQMRLYRVSEFRRARRYFVANVWDWDSQCKVEWLADGKPMGEMEQFTAVDEMYIRQQNMVNTDEEDAPTNHLFRCMPGKDVKQVTVVLTNRFGEKFQKTIESKPNQR